MSRRKLTLQEIQNIIAQWSDNDESNEEECDENFIPPTPHGDSAECDENLPRSEDIEEESDGEIFVESTSDQSSESEDGSDDEVTEADDNDIPTVHTSPNGISWSDQPFPVRLLNRNIIRFSPGPTLTPSSEKNSFLLFFDEEMISQIHLYTNKRMTALRKKPFSYDEIHAALGIIIRAGADRDNLSSLNSLFDPKDSRPYYRCAMSYNRFKLFLRHATMDNKSTRRTRQADDKMAAVRDVWNLFQRNLLKYYVPSENLTIDEQLYGYRGYIPGRSYMATKPAKYGIKIFWICDVNGFALKGIIYTGKVDGQRQTGLTLKLVKDLSIPFHYSSRNIYMDRYFTSFEAVSHLLDHGLSAVGTVTASRRDVPVIFKAVKGRECFSSKTLYEHSKKVLLLSYVPKKNKNVLMMSSFHQKPEIHIDREDKKSQIVLDYNSGKGGVDIMDSRIEDFTTKRKTNRYTMLLLFNVIDVSVNNAFLLFSYASPTLEKKTFMKNLSAQLAYENMTRRCQNPKVFAQTKDSFYRFGLPMQISPITNAACTANTARPSKCQEKGCRKSTRIKCQMCNKCICSDHGITIHACSSCH